MLVAFAGCGSDNESELIRQEIDEPLSAISISADPTASGSITINGIGEQGTGTSIDVTATYSDQLPEASTDVSNGVFTASYSCGGQETCDVQVAITTDNPAMDVTVESGASQISLRRFDGTIVLGTSSGPITLNQITGDVSAQAASGGIDAISLGPGNFALTTDSGAIDARWDAAPTVVEAASDSGSITLDVPEGSYSITATSSSGSVDSIDSDPAASSQITVTTNSGDISIS